MSMHLHPTHGKREVTVVPAAWPRKTVDLGLASTDPNQQDMWLFATLTKEEALTLADALRAAVR